LTINKTYPPIEIYKRLLSMSMPFWPMFVGVALSSAVYAASDAGFAYFIKQLTEVVAAGQELSERQLFIKRWLPLGVLLLFVVRGISNFLSTYGMAWISNHVVKTLRGRVFDKYLSLPTTFFDKQASGKLLSKLTYEVGQVADSASNAVIVIVKDTLTIIFLVIYMLILSVQLSLAVFVVAPLIALLVRYLSSLFRRHNRRIQAAVGDINRIGSEALQANRIIKIFGGQRYEADRFEGANEHNRRIIMRLVATSAIGNGLTVFVTAFGVAGVIYLISQIDIEVSLVAGFITAMVLIMAPLKRLTNVNATIQRGIAAGESLFAVLDEPAEIDQGVLAPEPISGRVEFRGVDFGYPGGEGLVLHDINLKVEPGETIALVGRSGSGKSTLVSLLPRFYDCQSGKILIDGSEIGAFSLSGLRRQISLVSQEVTLFNDTIAANIAYGGLFDATREQIEAAAVAAYVKDFTDEMKDGLDTVVGDRGVLLSGGQRQRISIARALLKNAPILILDEATSALDTESERYIQGALEGLMQSRTTFVIAHRLSTIENADRILVMQDGRIVESGTHAELLAADGAYATLHKLQFNEEGKSPAY
jgi:subfamily B ATP-binding cassette protein MsbA